MLGTVYHRRLSNVATKVNNFARISAFEFEANQFRYVLQAIRTVDPAIQGSEINVLSM